MARPSTCLRSRSWRKPKTVTAHVRCPRGPVGATCDRAIAGCARRAFRSQMDVACRSAKRRRCVWFSKVLSPSSWARSTQRPTGSVSVINQPFLPIFASCSATCSRIRKQPTALLRAAFLVSSWSKGGGGGEAGGPAGRGGVGGGAGAEAPPPHPDGAHVARAGVHLQVRVRALPVRRQHAVRPDAGDAGVAVQLWGA